MPATDYFARKPAYSRSRSGLNAAGATTPGSPHTPSLARSLSSQLAVSPAASYPRPDEDSLVYEFGSRCLRAGFAGDSAPRCIIPFGPDQNRRLNDFTASRPPSRSENDWARDWELWDLDVRNVDLGLAEDKIERALRNAHSKYLMLDQRARKIFLALPSTLPHPLISTILTVIFNAYQPASVQLWATPVLCAVSAGLRSALTIDIGWHETTVTALYEYREVLHKRSTRGAKLLTRNMADILREHAQTPEPISFETTEDIVTRMAWCSGTESRKSAEAVSLPLGTSSIQVPFDDLAKPVEQAFFHTPDSAEPTDDHDLPLPLLAYKCLLSLPLDVRAICISRIVITGGASDMPGLKPRILQEIDALVQSKGWNPVVSYGSATGKQQQTTIRPMTIPIRDKLLGSEGHESPERPVPPIPTENVPARDLPQERDEPAEKSQREASKRGITIQSTVRGVQTLGVWAGASLVASLKADAAFEVKRDDFLKHGLVSLSHAF
jgi:actin-related protein